MTRSRRSRWLLAAAVLCFASTCGPLLLYIAFGPADGNPIGLGLLAMLGVPVSLGLLGFGALLAIIERVAARRTGAARH